MRYAVYITRAQHWSFEARKRWPISDLEWRAYTATDAELQPLVALPCFDVTGKRVGTNPVHKTWEWVAHPAGIDPDMPKTFEYDRGGVIVRAPDPALLRKAVAVATALKAKVIGDDERMIGEPAAG